MTIQCFLLWAKQRGSLHLLHQHRWRGYKQHCEGVGLAVFAMKAAPYAALLFSVAHCIGCIQLDLPVRGLGKVGAARREQRHMAQSHSMEVVNAVCW